MAQAMKIFLCKRRSINQINQVVLDFPFLAVSAFSLDAISLFMAAFVVQPPIFNASFGPIDVRCPNLLASSGNSDLSLASLATLFAEPVCDWACETECGEGANDCVGSSSTTSPLVKLMSGAARGRDSLLK